MTVRVIILTGLCVAGPLPAFAQEAPALRPWHLSVAAGVQVEGGYPIGDRNAELRRNATGTPPPFTLFRAESAIGRVTGAEARVGLAITRAFAVEVSGNYSTPVLTVTVSQDGEHDGNAMVVETLADYAVDISGVYQLPINIGRRARPYVIGGGGYLRQLHEDRLLVETGRTLHAGGGVRYWLRGGGRSARALGLRAEARYVRRSGGIDFADQTRAYPSVSLLAFAGF